MASIEHSAATQIHKGAYVQSSDPGAVGARVLWIDTTAGYVFKKRNEANGGWDTMATLGISGTGPGNATIATKTSNYTATSLDYTLLCDASSAAFTITLPAAASNSGMILVLKKIDSGVNAVTIDANASELIDGTLTYVLTAQYESITIHCNGSHWWVL